MYCYSFKLCLFYRGVKSAVSVYLVSNVPAHRRMCLWIRLCTCKHTRCSHRNPAESILLLLMVDPTFVSPSHPCILLLALRDESAGLLPSSSSPSITPPVPSQPHPPPLSPHGPISLSSPPSSRSRWLYLPLFYGRSFASREGLKGVPRDAQIRVTGDPLEAAWMPRTHSADTTRAVDPHLNSRHSSPRTSQRPTPLSQKSWVMLVRYRLRLPFPSLSSGL